MFDSLLIANRGEIARRVIATARRMGIRTIAVYSDIDANLPHVIEADEAIDLGAPEPAASYLNTEAILAAAKRTNAQAVHPGYGFLSEKADFATAVTEAGMVWVGPSPQAIDAMGDKINARNLMARHDVPVAPGASDPVIDADAALAAAEQIGYPVMVKAAAGGGGMGMAVAEDAAALTEQTTRISGFAERLFGSPDVLIERYFPSIRHIEVQILGLPDGTVLALGERECSVQRRHQKLVEETPSPALTPEQRADILAASRRAGEAVDYRGAGTVEYLYDAVTGRFYFLEMNTRLQVEHPITEAVLGIDLVEAQLRIAAGEMIEVPSEPSGHAIELRVNAEDPKRFLPGPGLITGWHAPSGDGVRVDAGYREGNEVPRHYDSLMAKVIVHAPTRTEAIRRAADAAAAFDITGPKSNLAFHTELLANPEFVSGSYDTGIVGRMR
ncbi:MAG TPA: biotin carboxylase [Candidatus Stackebrandtia excrementipullorum]|nr:biotin carboxylase [Candidatus Stackebrandtia excrementipullorum]